MSYEGRGKRIRILEGQVRDLRVALDDLMDIQNGPPLVTYTEAWNAAMDQARAVMERTALAPPPPSEAKCEPCPCPICRDSGGGETK